ncbi:hypothetical protein ACIREO_19410 [Streptomyces sp. NPDC102441]|uniref:hypothetical protein n=1 Tax=Streptomyces sp. NPDC102441 TaxID=3366176 RepID=UPI00380BCAAE
MALRKGVESETDALRVRARKQMEDGQERLSRQNSLAGDRARQQRQNFSDRAITLRNNGVLHRALSDAVEGASLRQLGLSFVPYVRFLYIAG